MNSPLDCSRRAELRAERLLRVESNLETPVEAQADGAPLFRISDLSAGYDKKVVVEGVDLKVRAGDVVALIGPNGSGKSNISDSIRWVLGESSSKQLRGTGKMEDVIFGGTRRRGAMGFAQVRLTLDNSAYRFPASVSVDASQEALEAKARDMVDYTFRQLMMQVGMDSIADAGFHCNVCIVEDGASLLIYVLYAG